MRKLLLIALFLTVSAPSQANFGLMEFGDCGFDVDCVTGSNSGSGAVANGLTFASNQLQFGGSNLTFTH